MSRIVTVIAPCRNELGYIEPFCRAVARQHLPAGAELEVLIADGQSDDGTRQHVAALCAEDPRFVMVDNPGRIVSTGLNRCIERARGDVIVRMDIHTTYASDYIAQCLEAIDRTGAANVGGPWQALGVGPMGEAIAAAFQSRWVSGGAASRDLRHEGPVDTVYLGCWPRASFDVYGRFDESLVRNQDDEHNLRITKAGGVVWQSARIRSSYTPRSSLLPLFRQQMQYGYWKPFVMHKHGQAASLRQLVPGFFVGLWFVLLAVGLLWPPALLPWLLLSLAYGTYVVAATVDIVRQHAGDRKAVARRLPWVIVATHVGYGLGTWRGWFDVLWRRGKTSAALSGLTR